MLREPLLMLGVGDFSTPLAALASVEMTKTTPVISSTGRSPPPVISSEAKPAPLSFRPEARSAGVEKSHAPSTHEVSPLLCLTAPPVEMTCRGRAARRHLSP